MVIALDEMCWSAILSLFVCVFVWEAAVGIGESDAKDKSAPTQTAPQLAGFGLDRPSACW